MKDSSKQSWSLGKRVVATACSAALGVALLPAAAFAAEGDATASDATATDDNTTVIGVYIKDAETGAETMLTHAQYTQSDLDTMAAQNTGTKSYVYTSRSGTNVVSTNKYVTLDQILEQAGDSWGEGSSVTFSAPDGFGSDYTYETATATQYFYPEGTVSGPSGTGTETSMVIGLDQAKGTLSGDSTAQDVVNSFTDESYTTEETPRVYTGLSEGATSYLAGRNFASNINKITVTYPHHDFQVLAENSDTGTVTTVKNYTTAELEELAKQNTQSVSYIYNARGGTSIYTATSYVTLSQLIGSDERWVPGSSIVVNTPDNFSAEFSYEDMTTPRYFYPEYTTSSASDANAVEVPSIVALTYKSGTLSGESTAQDIATANLTAEDAGGTPRWLAGNTAVDSIQMGRRSPQQINTLTIKYSYKDLYDNAQKQLAETQTALDTANSDLATANANLATANESLTSTQAQLATAQSQLTAAQEQASTTASQLSAAQQQVTSLTSQVSSLQTQVSTAQSERDAAQQQVTETQQQLATAQAAARTAQNKLSSITKNVKEVTVNAKTVNASAISKAISKVGGSTKYVKTVTLGKNVKKVSAKAFKNTKVTKVVVKTTKLTKKSVKNAFKGSKVKTVEVQVNADSYAKVFTKAVTGKSVTLKSTGSKAFHG